MDADLRHFEAFLAVARHGHFTRAAAALHVSQPALTVQIRQLERGLGVRLFDRNNRRVALTAAGREFVAPVERLLLDHAAIVRQAGDLSAGLGGVVTVAALPSVAAGLLPSAIQRLTRQRDGIVVRVRDVITGRLIDLVRAGDVDFGIGSLTRPDPGIAVERLMTDRLCAFAPVTHPISAKRRVTLRELSGYPLILTGRDSSVRQLFERALERERLPAHIAQEATYMSTAIGMARAGLGVAVLPQSARPDRVGDDVRAIEIRQPVLTRDIGILWRMGRSLSPPARLLVGALRADVRAATSQKRQPTPTRVGRV